MLIKMIKKFFGKVSAWLKKFIMNVVRYIRELFGCSPSPEKEEIIVRFVIGNPIRKEE